MINHTKKDKTFYIQQDFPITDQEYKILDEKFGRLCWDAARKLAMRNNVDQDTLEDYHTEVVIGMCRSGSYYKRQTFIEKCLLYLGMLNMTNGDHRRKFRLLKKMWGRNKEAFGTNEERALYDMLKSYNCDVDSMRMRCAELRFDDKFDIYCKSIIWNTVRSIGQSISKERKHNKGTVSLDEYAFLARDFDDGDGMDELSVDPYYGDECCEIRDILLKYPDEQLVGIFDIIIDPENEDKLIKKKKDGEIKFNIIRQKSGLSYSAIHKKLTRIKNIIENENLSIFK